MDFYSLLSRLLFDCSCFSSYRVHPGAKRQSFRRRSTESPTITPARLKEKRTSTDQQLFPSQHRPQQPLESVCIPSKIVPEQWVNHPPRRRTPSSILHWEFSCEMTITKPCFHRARYGGAFILTYRRRIMGTGVAWTMRNQSKGDFLAGNRTQTG